MLEQEASAPETALGGPDVVGRYLSEIGRYPLLDRDGEARLASAVQAGIRAGEQLSQPGEFTAEGRRQEGTEPSTLAEAAAVLGISRERARQLETRTLARLRHLPELAELA